MPLMTFPPGWNEKTSLHNALGRAESAAKSLHFALLEIQEFIDAIPQEKFSDIFKRDNIKEDEP